MGGVLVGAILVEMHDRLRVPNAVATLLCVALGAAAVVGAVVVAPG